MTTKRGSAYLPPMVARQIDELEAAVSGVAKAKQLSGGRWQVEVVSGRVKATFILRSSGTCTLSKLVVDGRPKTVLFDDLATQLAIIRDPQWRPPAPPLHAIVEPELLHRAPEVVRQFYRRVASSLSGAYTVTVGRLDGRWVITADCEADWLRINFRQLPNGGRWIIDPYTPVQSVVDGVDQAEDIEEDMDKVFKRAVARMNKPRQQAAAAPGISDTAGPSGFGSAEVRSSTVMRN